MGELNLNVTCRSCGWVHFGVSKDYIQKWNDEWAELFKTKPKKWLASFGVTDKPPSDRSYYHCFFCDGPHTNFRKSKPGDCPDGCTTQPILVEDK